MTYNDISSSLTSGAIDTDRSVTLMVAKLLTPVGGKFVTERVASGIKVQGECRIGIIFQALKSLVTTIP